MIGGAVDQAALGGHPSDEEVEQHPALGSEQGGEADFALPNRLDVLGDQPLQERPPIGAVERDHRATGRGASYSTLSVIPTM